MGEYSNYLFQATHEGISKLDIRYLDCGKISYYDLEALLIVMDSSILDFCNKVHLVIQARINTYLLENPVLQNYKVQTICNRDMGIRYQATFNALRLNISDIDCRIFSYLDYGSIDAACKYIIGLIHAFDAKIREQLVSNAQKQAPTPSVWK